MCLLFVAIDTHPDYRLVIAANRDEYLERPTAEVGFWEDAPQVLAGRDLSGGGTWLGIDRAGRWAAVTNYREPQAATRESSRGHLVRDYLLGSASAEVYAAQALASGASYAGFNLLLGDGRQAIHCSNRHPDPTVLDQGVFGLSNHLLDTPWPKLVRGKARFAAQVTHGGPLDVDPIFEILADREEAESGQLPDTGVGQEMERILSPAFIAVDGYGTRSSTVLSIRHDGRVEFTERRFQAGSCGAVHPDHYESSTYRMTIPG
jgi:uncharacterized protein with NRDE domain